MAVLSANYINNQVAANRARTVISAVETYHARHGVYPTSLNDLPPSYLTNVPKAKYTLSGFNDFRYRNIDGFTSIQYTSVPPFSRPTYVFNQKKWIYID